MKTSLTRISNFTVVFYLIVGALLGCESNSSSPQEEPFSSESQAATSSDASSSSNLESSSSLDPLAISSSSSSERFSFGELIDERDGQVYKTIVIADSTRSQTWMAENLNFDYPVNPPKTDVNNYNDTTKVLKKYGKLYTWSSAIDSAGLYNNDAKGCGYAATCEMADTVHGICPKGYHLPNTDEFKTLQNITVTLGPYSGQKLKAETDDWQDVKTIYGTYVHTYGTDNYGFGALPTYAPGSRYAAIFWTFSQSSSDPTSHGSALDYAFKIIGYEWPDMSPVELELEYKDTYFSIRCIQDAH